jgi:hypothetical protein
MSDEVKVVSKKARATLNILAIKAIAIAQQANGVSGAGPIDLARVQRALGEIEQKVADARRELSQG